MFLDFNVSKADFPLAERPALAVIHLSKVFENFVKSIAHLAKLTFYALATAFTFNQCETFRIQFRAALAHQLNLGANVGLSVVGFFAPINASEWKETTRNWLNSKLTPAVPTAIESKSLMA